MGLLTWYNNWFMVVGQVNPSDVIILEGILVFHDPRIRDLMNMKIFVDTGASLSLLSLYVSILINNESATISNIIISLTMPNRIS